MNAHPCRICGEVLPAHDLEGGRCAGCASEPVVTAIPLRTGHKITEAELQAARAFFALMRSRYGGSR